MRRTKHVQVALSEDSLEALKHLSGEVKVLTDLVTELLKAYNGALGVLKGEIAVAVARGTGDPVDGIKVFDTDEPPGEPVDYEVAGPAESNDRGERPGLPEAMQHRTMEDTSGDDPDRVRSTPWTRAPLHVQYDWLREYMADGRWYSSYAISDAVADDERHRRYLRGALSSRLREMHQEGDVQRRDSKVKGSMFEYRLRPDHISSGPQS